MEKYPALATLATLATLAGAAGQMGKPILGNGDLDNTGQSCPQNNLTGHSPNSRILFLWTKLCLPVVHPGTGELHNCIDTAPTAGQIPSPRCLIAIRSTAKSAPGCDNIDHHWTVKSSPSQRCLILIGPGHAGLRQLLPGALSHRRW